MIQFPVAVSTIPFRDVLAGASTDNSHHDGGGSFEPPPSLLRLSFRSVRFKNLVFKLLGVEECKNHKTTYFEMLVYFPNLK